MSKTKKSGPGRYELLFIVPNNYTEDEAKQIISKTENMLIENQATIVYREYWGKKKLAYPISHNHYGYYNLFEFEAEKNHVLELSRLLKLSKEILRYQIISVAALSDEQRELIKTKQAAAVVKDKDRKDEKKTKEKNTDDTEEKSKEVKKEKKETTKAELKDLDEKLEGIISAKDLV